MIMLGCLRRLPLKSCGNPWRCLASASPSVEGKKRRYDCLFLDVAGTLLLPAQPVGFVYREFAAKRGIQISEEKILEQYRRAFQTRPKKEPWAQSTLRYVGDARDFWRYIVQEATGSSDEILFETLYSYYGKAEAWSIPDGAVDALERLKDEGVKTAVVSNFDTRLRPLLHDLKLGHLFDQVVCSAEVKAEKPNPVIFEKGLEMVGMEPWQVVHVGDDRRNDLWGARDAGIDVWLWGVDVKSYKDIADRILGENVDGDSEFAL
ncbi:hypothetical protein BSKO_11292 [Bryopsis sp. KO-2023]|nr:hypothetical protein BSKO_11292 [Bryopsis sp. KO-2023]